MNSLIKLFFTLLTLLAFSSNLWAQDEEVLLQQMGEITPDLTSLSNQLWLNQEGYGNSTLIILMQTGSMNYAGLYQEGNGNMTHGMQDGYSNSIESSIWGNFNRSAFIQSGDYNKIQQEIRGDNMNYTIIQEGNYNEAIQIENGIKSKEYKIIQQGDHMRVYIKNGNHC